MRDMRKCERVLAQLAFSSQHFFLRRISISEEVGTSGNEKCSLVPVGINQQAAPTILKRIPARASTSSRQSIQQSRPMVCVESATPGKVSTIWA